MNISFLLSIRGPPRSTSSVTLCPYATPVRSGGSDLSGLATVASYGRRGGSHADERHRPAGIPSPDRDRDDADAAERRVESRSPAFLAVRLLRTRLPMVCGRGSVRCPGEAQPSWTIIIPKTYRSRASFPFGRQMRR